MTVIYIDVLLFLNWIVDYLLLCGCARVLHLPCARGRLLLAAGTAALSSLLILLPPMNVVVSLLCKLGTACLSVPLAFGWRSFSRFCKAVFTLFVLSAAFAGLCYGMVWFLASPSVLVQSGIVYVSISPLTLLVMTVISYGVLCVYDRFTRRRMLKDALWELEIVCGDERVPLRAFYDSGHKLRESFSGAPVIVVRRQSLGPLCTLAEPCLGAAGASTLRYIPFSSIGGGGVLPSFRPTAVVIRSNTKSVTLHDVWVAVCERLNAEDYDALIGADISMTGECL